MIKNRIKILNKIQACLLIISLLVINLTPTLVRAESNDLTISVESKEVTYSGQDQIVSVDIELDGLQSESVINAFEIALVYDDSKLSLEEDGIELGSQISKGQLVNKNPEYKIKSGEKKGKTAVYIAYADTVGITEATKIAKLSFKVSGVSQSEELDLEIDKSVSYLSDGLDAMSYIASNGKITLVYVGDTTNIHVESKEVKYSKGGQKFSVDIELDQLKIDTVINAFEIVLVYDDSKLSLEKDGIQLHSNISQGQLANVNPEYKIQSGDKQGKTAVYISYADINGLTEATKIASLTFKISGTGKSEELDLEIDKAVSYLSDELNMLAYTLNNGKIKLVYTPESSDSSDDSETFTDGALPEGGRDILAEIMEIINSTNKVDRNILEKVGAVTRSSGKISSQDMDTIIEKIFEKIEKVNQSMIPSLQDIVNATGFTKEIEARKEGDAFVATVGQKDIHEAIKELLEKVDGLKAHLTEEEFAKLKENIVLTIPVSGVAEKDNVSILIENEALKELGELGIGIKFYILGSSVRIPNGAYSSQLGHGNNGDLLFKREVLSEEKNSEIQSKLAKELKIIGSMYKFSLTLADKNINSFEKNLRVEMDLPKGLNEVYMGNKIMLYNFGQDGKVEDFFAGKIQGEKHLANIGHFSVYSLVEYNKTFADIQGRWSQNAIEICAARQITNGVTTDLFAPEKNITRGQFAAMLARAVSLKSEANLAAFEDVNENTYYAASLAALKEKNLIGGYGDGTFRPNQTITREEMTKMIVDMYVFLTDEEIKTGESTFKDINDAEPWAKDKINAAAKLGIVNGIGDGLFDPKGKATREQVGKMIVKLLEKTGSM